MTERQPPMSDEEVSRLLTDCINATIRFDSKTVGALMDRIFLEGTAEDGMRFALGCMQLIATHASPGEALYLQMMADLVSGDPDRALNRWIESLLTQQVVPTGAPGGSIGVALRQAAAMVGRGRAKLQ
jgi:hypothetical protein